VLKDAAGRSRTKPLAGLPEGTPEA
jgi:hypothetical protein